MDTEKFFESKRNISVEEMQDLLKKVELFYSDREHPTINAIWLSNQILKRLRNDLDYYINCEGMKGYGKSNLILLMALLQSRYSGFWKNTATGEIVKVYPRTTPLPGNWKQISCFFDFEKNMSFLDNSQQVQEKFNSLGKYMPFIIDEGSKNLHKYNWQQKVQFKLVQLSDTERWQNKSFFVCFPNFKELNSVFRNDRMAMRLYVYYRSRQKGYASAIISLKDVNRWIIDPWHMDENAKMFEYLLRKVPAAQRNHDNILYAEKKLMGYAGNFDFPPLEKLSPRIWKTYKRYKTKNALKESIDGEINVLESKNIIRWKYATKMLMAYIKQKHPELKTDDFKELTNVSVTSLNQLWREKLEVEEERELKLRAANLLK